MKIWLVNPFDPLPGDVEQEGRYATLARMIAARGHRLTWWTSAFSHRFKKPVDQAAITTACKAAGFDVRFLQGCPYATNISLRRVKNHRQLARDFARQARAAPSGDRPQMMLASAPPPWLALAAARFAREGGAKFVIDVQDLWPETFTRLAPAWARGAFKAAMWPVTHASNQAYAAADAVVGVADAYAQRALAAGRRDRLCQTIPLGIDLPAFDAAAAAGRMPQFVKAPGEVWMIYSGSLSRSYDPLTIVRAFAKSRGQFRSPARLFISGQGEHRQAAQRIIDENKLDNVSLVGFLEFPAWANLVSRCDMGFNASFPEAMIFLPNKIFYYLAGSLAVLNTIPGQCSRIVSDGACGLNYRAGDVADCAAAMTRLVNNPQERAEMARHARELAETVYSRTLLYPKFVDLLERVAK